MENKQLKKWMTIAVIISTLSLLLSIAILCLRVNFCLTSSAIISSIIGILAIFITILIVWQIYSFWDFKQQQKINDRLAKIETDIEFLKTIAHSHEIVNEDSIFMNMENINYPFNPTKNKTNRWNSKFQNPK